MYYTKTELLAHELADKLEDQDAYPLYLTYAKRFSEEKLRNILYRVLSIPDEKIKRTRGALFTFLIGKHAEQENRGSWR